MSKLFEYREKLNITQEELSTKSGISVRTIQRIEAGTIPKGHTLKALAEALEIEENKLLKKESKTNGINYTLLKFINLSSLLFVFIPPVNILLPLIIMFAKKQFNPLTKQLVTIQILWTILMLAVFLIGAILNSWLLLEGDLVIFLLIVLGFCNVFIIIRNTVELDQNKKLYINLNFSII
mgnify:CR=1 FL=1